MADERRFAMKTFQAPVSMILSGGLLALLLAGPALAEDDPLSGRFRLGWRSVDVGGSETKYREDIDLEDGARLFELRIDFRPKAGESQFADRVELDLSNFGGDPFESLRFDLRKYGAYKFSYHRTKSAYFYEDVILPLDLSSPALSDAGDFHHFDFDRVRDTANLEITLSPAARLDVGFERFTKRGESTTTLDIQRDEFELDRPVEESYNDFSVGFQYAWEKVTLVLEERVRDYDNGGELFLPGRSLGEDPADATVLDFFFFEGPYEIETQQHTVRLNARPTDRLRLRGAVVVQNLELEGTATERSQGTTFTGAPNSTDLAGSGEIERDTELFDFDFSCRLSERFALVGGARRHAFDQDGSFAFDGALNVGVWDVETDSFELGLESALTPDLTLALGLRTESRDVETAHATDGDLGELEEESTEHDGFFVNLVWRASKQFHVEAELEESSYNDPFTLTSPSDRQRLRLRARWRAENGFNLQGTYVAHRYENDTVDWNADRDQFTFRMGWNRDGLALSAGYSLLEADRSVDQFVTTNPGFGGGVTFLYPILYESEAEFFDAQLRYRATDRFSFGGQARVYDNSGTFAVARDDLRVYVEVGFGKGYLLNLAWRTVDYDEDEFDFDDYDADIAELSIGYRW